MAVQDNWQIFQLHLATALDVVCLLTHGIGQYPLYHDVLGVPSVTLQLMRIVLREMTSNNSRRHECTPGRATVQMFGIKLIICQGTCPNAPWSWNRIAQGRLETFEAQDPTLEEPFSSFNQQWHEEYFEVIGLGDVAGNTST